MICKRIPTIVAALLYIATATAVFAKDDPREWTDSTGRFKVIGTLVEVTDGNALIKRVDGKILKIPVTRLSQQDQSYLDTNGSPFEMIEDAATGTKASQPAATMDRRATPWSTPYRVDWDRPKRLVTLAGVEWRLPPSEGGLTFAPKRTPLTRKSTFHEHMHPAVVNVRSKRAVVGRTVSFAVPKPLTRLTLVDLVTGKSVDSDVIEANMRPLALLDNGHSVLMVGEGDGRSGGETPDHLEIWSFKDQKITRSPGWVPYKNDKDGGRANANVLDAQLIGAGKVVTLSETGHIASWDIESRNPLWHGHLSERNFAMAASADRKLLAVFDEKTLMVLDPETAEILGSTALPPNAASGWPKIAWSPNGKQLLLTSVSDIRVLDVETGQWVVEFSLPGGAVATRALSFPDADYALLDNRLLVHLPTRIQVCEYRDAGAITTIGGTSFVSLHSDAGGILEPVTLPHPGASQILQKAIADPTVFLIHPGVAVAIDVSGVPVPHQDAVRKGLEQSAIASKYKVEDSAPVKIVGSITGPKQEAISYIAAGAYIVNQYTSTIQLRWNEKDLWTTSGTNIPGVLMTKRGQTMQEALDEAGKQPNVYLFANTRFPEFMQQPGEGEAGGRQSPALMSASFTVQGLVDTQ